MAFLCTETLKREDLTPIKLYLPISSVSKTTNLLVKTHEVV